MRVSSAPLPTDTWHHYLRARDVAQVFQTCADDSSLAFRNGTALEIGCGDGFVTGLLRQRFSFVATMDPAPRAALAGGCVAIAEELPFRTASFDCIFSSNVMEHVPGLERALSEMRRVLRDDGLMIHTIPTVTWKLVQMGLYPAYLARLLAAKALGRGRDAHPVKSAPQVPGALSSAQGASESSSGKNVGTMGETAANAGWKKLLPPVHGASTGNLDELLRFRTSYWRTAFTRAGFEVVRTEPLFLHSAYRLFPFRGLAVREALSRAGLAAVTAFWCRKAGAAATPTLSTANKDAAHA